MVHGINFSGNVDKSNPTGNVRQNNSVALPKAPLWANYFKRFASFGSTANIKKNETLEDLKGTMSPAMFEALQIADMNFTQVPDRVIQNKNNENLVIKDSDYIPDRQYEEAEV